MMIHKQPHAQVSVAEEQTQRMILDGHKLPWHMDRVAAWERGERIAPITIDMALTRKCDAACSFCYAMLQENDGGMITEEVMNGFLEDCAAMGVRAVSLVSDGESLLSPAYVFTVQRGRELGLSIASGTNGRTFTPAILSAVLPSLDYLRFNVSAGQKERYAEIMGFKPEAFDRVCANIKEAVRIKHVGCGGQIYPVTIGIQMVLMPQDADQILPFAQLGLDMGVDYAVIKHCSDDEDGRLGVRYSEYEKLHGLLYQAEGMSTPETKIVVKWNKIRDEGRREYQRCYGPPFLIQISGSGLVAPCGMLFNDRYAKFHIGNITEQRWMDIWKSERYWEVMQYLGSENFNAQKMCGTLCLQHMVNTALDRHVKGDRVQPATTPAPLHRNFV